MAGNVTFLARIEKVEHSLDTGWYRIHAVKDDGGKIRLGTKIREKAEEAATLKDKPNVRIWANEKPSNKINPHTNQPYPPDYWYERAEETVLSGGNGGGIETVGEAPQAAPEIPAEASRTHGEDPRRSWRICLQSGAKLAVQTLPLMPNEQRSFEVQKQIALAWAKWFYFTPPPSTDSMGEQIPTPQQAYAEVGAGYDPGSTPQDDIPW